MTRSVPVKICGLRGLADVQAVAEAGARYAGFNFFAKSPRSVDFDAARELALACPPGLAKVALTVNEDDDFIDQLVRDVPLDMLQLHGSESPERVTALRARHGLPVMKVIGVADADDVPRIAAYETVADQILVDAKPPKNAVLPGGNGLRFDWRLIAGRDWSCPWMLAGGLTPDNVAEAIAATGATQVDVASGVESAPGEKDAAKIRAFCAAAQS